MRLINIHGALGQNAVFDNIHIIVKINSHIHALKAVTELIDDVAHKLVPLLLNGAAPNHLFLLKVINTRAVEYHRRLIGGDTIVIALQAGGQPSGSQGKVAPRLCKRLNGVIITPRQLACFVIQCAVNI